MLPLPHAFSHQFNLAGFEANESKAEMIKKGIDSILEAGVHRASSITRGRRRLWWISRGCLIPKLRRSRASGIGGCDSPVVRVIVIVIDSSRKDGFCDFAQNDGERAIRRLRRLHRFWGRAALLRSGELRRVNRPCYKRIRAEIGSW